MKVRDGISLFLSDLERREVSPAHRKNTRWRVHRLCEPWLALEAEALTRRMITERVQHLETLYAEASVAGLVQAAKALFGFWARAGICAEPLGDHLRPRSFRSRTVKAAPGEVVARLGEAVPHFVRQREEHPRDVRDGLIVMLSLQSGARLSGIANLRRSDMLAALRRPYGTGSGRLAYHVPTRSKGRQVALIFYSETAELFELWERVRPRFPREADRVCVSLKSGEALRSSSVSNAFNRLCAFAGVPVVRSHAIRHRNVTDILRAGADPKVAAVYAGHSSEAVTMAHYRHVVGGEVEDAMARVLARRQDETAFQEGMDGLFGLES